MSTKLYTINRSCCPLIYMALAVVMGLIGIYASFITIFGGYAVLELL